MPLVTFLARPDIDDARLELIDGEVFEKPMPTWGHGSLALIVGALLNDVGFAAVEPRAIIPPAGNLDASSPLPDVAFYRNRPPALDEWMTRAPDVVVEILSPSQERRDLRAKVDAYVAFGVGSVWVISPPTSDIDVYEHGTRRTIRGNEVLASPYAPGFSITVADLFDRLRRE